VEPERLNSAGSEGRLHRTSTTSTASSLLMSGSAKASSSASGRSLHGPQKLTGDARKSFMSECLGSKASGSGTSTGNPQQDKMRYCNFQASDRHLTGDARKSFVSDCLQGQ
jgi:hypothetical protein